MSKRLLLTAVSALLIAFGSIGTAFAQGSSGMLDGHIVDAAGSGVAGVAVSVSDARTGLTRTATTNDSGNFKMQLPPGIYELKSTKSGYTSVTIEKVMVNLGATASVTIPVTESAIEEITTYGTATSLMPAATGETGLNISLEELSMVPVARNIESVALLAPGTIAGDVAFGDDKTLVSFGGASVAENVYYIDGLNVTNFRNGLGGSSVPFEFYDQFQIKTGGYGAEFGRSTGGVINAITKRGSNEWEYGVVMYSDTSIFQGDSPNTILADGTLYDLNSENEQTGFTTDIYVGGPILKDRLFFYALYEPSDSEAIFNSLGDSGQQNVQKTEDDFWGGNLTWNITDNHSLSYTAFTDEREIKLTQYDYDTDSRVRGAEVGQSSQFRGGDNQILRYDGNFGENFVVSAMWGKNEYNLTDQSTNDVNCPLIVDDTDSQPDGRFPGCWITSTVQQGGDEREAYRIDVEYYLGDHTIRAGFDREDNASIDATVYPGYSFTPDLVGGAYYYYQTWAVGEELPNGALVPDVNGDGSDVDTVRFRYIENGGSFDTISQAWYIEDRWQINDQFTLSAGLRNEKFENNNAQGATFIGIDDQWAPRLAFEWTPGGRGDQVMTLNWGRYHLPIAANTNVRLSGAELDYRRYFVYDGSRDATTGAPTAVGSDGLPTTQELGSITINSDGTVPDTSAIVDQNLDPMFQDEWILQYERELNENWTAGIRYIYRELSSTIDDILVDQALELMEDRGEFSGPIGASNDCHYVLTNPGNDMTTFCEHYNTFGDPTSGTSLVLTNLSAADLQFPEAERTYEAWEITVDGQVGDWTINGSYTYSKNEGNTEGYVKSDIGQDDAGITQDFDIPSLMDGAFGYLPNDRRHKMKLWASYQVSDRLTLGGNLFLQSGRPINSFGIGHPDGTPDYGDTFYLTTDVGDPAVDGDETFLFTPRGSAGRTDWITRIDLAAIYSFNWADRAEVELRAEVFNLLDAESAREVYEFAEISPDQFRMPTSFQRPRYIRLGAALRFR
jgi:outer membrane receptor protein involved in Fe transport